MTTLTEMLAKFGNEDMKEVTKYKCNETLGDFLKSLKITAKQAFGEEA